MGRFLFHTNFLLFVSLAMVRAQTPLADGPPRLLESTKPEYPPQLKEQRIIGAAVIAYQIDETGLVSQAAVEQASLEEFGRSALEAVRRFKYEPAVGDGKKQAKKVKLEVSFALSDEELAELDARRPKEALPPGPPPLAVSDVDELPVLKKEIRPKTPEVLVRSSRLGQAMIGFIVDEHGVPRDVHSMLTTHAECAIEAMAVIRRWKFTPATKDGRPVRVILEVPMAFFPENPSANGAKVRPGVGAHPSPEGTEPSVPAPDYEFVRPIQQQPIEFPVEMSARGRLGRVVVEFVISPRGMVTQAKSVNTTSTFFSVLVERAVSHWTFVPAKKGGAPVATYARQLVEFRY